MKEIIFRFTTSVRLEYWFKYVLDFLDKKGILVDINMNYRRAINLSNIVIRFEVDRKTSAAYDINQYWVEDLFDNNFEEFFIQIMKEEAYG